jgi:hypothetical protein
VDAFFIAYCIVFCWFVFKAAYGSWRSTVSYGKGKGFTVPSGIRLSAAIAVTHLSDLSLINTQKSIKKLPIFFILLNAVCYLFCSHKSDFVRILA